MGGPGPDSSLARRACKVSNWWLILPSRSVCLKLIVLSSANSVCCCVLEYCCSYLKSRRRIRRLPSTWSPVAYIRTTSYLLYMLRRSSINLSVLLCPSSISSSKRPSRSLRTSLPYHDVGPCLLSLNGSLPRYLA